MAGGVIDGQAVSQGITNPAFIIKNADDTMPHVLSMAAPTSGPVINDVQNTLNVLVTGVGGNQSTAAWQYPLAPSNTIVSGVDTHQLALEKLAIKFYGLAASGGHTHSGVDGDGATVIAVDSIAASGYAAATGNIIIAASGDIAISQSGKIITIYSTPDPAEVNSLNGLTGDIVIAASGGTAVGVSGQNINIYSNPLAPTATAAQSVASANSGGTSASASRVDHVHQGVHSMAASGSSSLFGDVILAASGEVSLSQSGNTITIFSANDPAVVSSLNGLTGAVTLAPSGGTVIGTSGQNINIYSVPTSIVAAVSVGTANSAGVGVSAAAYDHVHQGVHSFAASGSSAMFGDVTISASGAIVLAESGQNVVIYAPTDAAAVNSLNGLTGVVSIAASGGTAVGVSGQNINVYSNPLAPSATAVNSVGTPNAGGVSVSAARVDHTHEGVHSVAVSGSTGLFSDVTFAASGEITLSQSGQNITIYAPAAAASGSAVNTLNGLTGAVTIAASGGTQVGVSGQNINVYSVPLAPTGTAVSSVGSTNSQGTGASAARYDHVHQGVHSIAASGQTALNGDVLLVAGTNITLSQTSQNITITASGGGSVGNWTSSASTISPTNFGTVTSKFVRYLHSGNTLRVTGYFVAGTVAAATCKLALSGFTIDTTLFGTGQVNLLGKAYYLSSGSSNLNSSNIDYVVWGDSADSGSVYISGQAGTVSSNTFQPVNTNAIFASSQGVSFDFEVPVT